MKFGVNLLLFDGVVTPRVLGWFPRLRALGFDGVEVPMFEPDRIPVDRIRARAERCGLALTASGALPPGTRWYGKDRTLRRKAEAYLRGSLRVCRELGAPVFCGPLYKAVGDMDQSLSLERQRAQTAEALRPLLGEAEAAGVRLAFEPLNRFETNVLNTAAQGIDFCAALRSPAAGLLLDTFHMHIEEKDTAKALRAAGRAGAFAHFHAAENDRGAAGSGQVAWAAAAQGVKAARYDGWCVLESFSQTVEAIRTAVSCWRPFYASPEAFCRQGLRFVRKTFGA